jgi:hypothetical protein
LIEAQATLVNMQASFAASVGGPDEAYWAGMVANAQVAVDTATIHHSEVAAEYNAIVSEFTAAIDEFGNTQSSLCLGNLYVRLRTYQGDYMCHVDGASSNDVGYLADGNDPRCRWELVQIIGGLVSFMSLHYTLLNVCGLTFTLHPTSTFRYKIKTNYGNYVKRGGNQYGSDGDPAIEWRIEHTE